MVVSCLTLQPAPSLKEFHTTPSNKKHGISILPGEEYRLKDEEIQSEVEFQRQSNATESQEDRDDSEGFIAIESQQDNKLKLLEQQQQRVQDMNASQMSEEEHFVRNLSSRFAGNSRVRHDQLAAQHARG